MLSALIEVTTAARGRSLARLNLEPLRHPVLLTAAVIAHQIVPEADRRERDGTGGLEELVAALDRRRRRPVDGHAEARVEAVRALALCIARGDGTRRAANVGREWRQRVARCMGDLLIVSAMIMDGSRKGRWSPRSSLPRGPEARQLCVLREQHLLLESRGQLGGTGPDKMGSLEWGQRLARA